MRLDAVLHVSVDVDGEMTVVQRAVSGDYTPNNTRLTGAPINTSEHVYYDTFELAFVPDDVDPDDVTAVEYAWPGHSKSTTRDVSQVIRRGTSVTLVLNKDTKWSG